MLWTELSGNTQLALRKLNDAKTPPAPLSTKTGSSTARPAPARLSMPYWKR